MPTSGRVLQTTSGGRRRRCHDTSASHRSAVHSLDGLIGYDGYDKIIETNTEGTGGVIQNGLAARVWSSIPNPLTYMALNKLDPLGVEVRAESIIAQYSK